MSDIHRHDVLVNLISAARKEQRSLLAEKLELSLILDERTTREWFRKKADELRTKTIPALERTVAALSYEKSHLVTGVNTHHIELDELATLRASAKKQRRESQMEHSHEIMVLRNSLAVLQRDVFATLKAEGVPEQTVCELYLQLHKKEKEKKKEQKGARDRDWWACND
jgi:hypothetical protein